MAEEIIFADGMGLTERKDNTPEFVINKFYFNADKFSQFLQENKSEKGWVYVDMLMSQKGVPYFKLNNFKPLKKDEAATPAWKPKVKAVETIEYPEEDINPDDVPF